MHEDEILFTEFFNERLKERGYTLKQLSDATGIAMKHLENFSHGRFENLPSAPYVHGYFVKLGDILGFDPDEWWNRIKEEDTVHKSGGQDRLPVNRFSRARGRALVWGGVIVLLAVIYFAARFTTIIGEPRIILATPEAAVVRVYTSPIIFEGQVRNGDSLVVNGASVPLGAEGNFSTEVALSPGVNTIEIRARKTLGRETTLTRQIHYEATPIILPVPGAEVPVRSTEPTIPTSSNSGLEADNDTTSTAPINAE